MDDEDSRRTVKDSEIVACFRDTDQIALTAGNVADSLPIGRDAVRYRLKQLVEEGILVRQQLDSRRTIYYLPSQKDGEPSAERSSIFAVHDEISCINYPDDEFDRFDLALHTAVFGANQEDREERLGFTPKMRYQLHLQTGLMRALLLEGLDQAARSVPIIPVYRKVSAYHLGELTGKALREAVDAHDIPEDEVREVMNTFSQMHTQRADEEERKGVSKEVSAGIEDTFSGVNSSASA